MTRHLLKLIWNRKRTNLLLMAEIFFSFLVLFAATTFGLFYLDNYRRPLGFVYEPVWQVAMDPQESGPPEALRSQREAAERLLSAAREFPEVESAALAFTSPYTNSTWSSNQDVDGRTYRYCLNQVSDDFRSVMGLTLVAGRWFSREDDGATWQPVVITLPMAKDVFGDLDPLGKSIPQEKRKNGEPSPELRVIGVVSDFRQWGELAAPQNYLFHRQRTDDPKGEMPRSLALKIRPGTTAAFEEKLIARLQETARDFSFRVQPLTEMRASYFREHLAPLYAVAMVVAFLLLMVALGLTGVLWQSVTQRTREVGLRRAKGATAIRIQQQILGELAVMASLALLAGAAVVVQFPLLDVIGVVNARVYALSLLLSGTAIFALTLACGFYPARLATRIEPAEALHYE